MRRTDWKRILKRDYQYGSCALGGIDGIASLITIHEVTQPLKVLNGEHEVTIVDKGISWLQIALREQYVWVTAMFDPQGRLLQVYFDVTNGNPQYIASNDETGNPSLKDGITYTSD